MEKYKKLLESGNTSDIVLGLYLMSREGLIKDNSRIPVNYKEQFVIRVDGYSGWTSWHNGKSCVSFVEGEDHFGWNLIFDFRTKKEE